MKVWAVLSPNCRQGSTPKDFFFCQIDMEISKATLRRSTQLCGNERLSVSNWADVRQLFLQLIPFAFTHNPKFDFGQNQNILFMFKWFWTRPKMICYHLLKFAFLFFSRLVGPAQKHFKDISRVFLLRQIWIVKYSVIYSVKQFVLFYEFPDIF